MAKYTRGFKMTRARQKGFTWRPIPYTWEARVATGTYYEIAEQARSGYEDEHSEYKVTFYTENEEYMAPKDVDAGSDSTGLMVDKDIRGLSAAKHKAEAHWDAWRAHPGTGPHRGRKRNSRRRR
jgi:hypothetical protein